MGKILLGAGTAALWLVLAHAANAERVCKQVCDHGTCVSKCVENSEPDVIVRERDRHDQPGIELHAPGVGFDIGR